MINGLEDLKLSLFALKRNAVTILKRVETLENMPVDQNDVVLLMDRLEHWSNICDRADDLITDAKVAMGYAEIGRSNVRKTLND